MMAWFTLVYLSHRGVVWRHANVVTIRYQTRQHLCKSRPVRSALHHYTARSWHSSTAAAFTSSTQLTRASSPTATSTSWQCWTACTAILAHFPIHFRKLLTKMHLLSSSLSTAWGRLRSPFISWCVARSHRQTETLSSRSWSWILGTAPRQRSYWRMSGSVRSRKTPARLCKWLLGVKKPRCDMAVGGYPPHFHPKTKRSACPVPAATSSAPRTRVQPRTEASCESNSPHIIHALSLEGRDCDPSHPHECSARPPLGTRYTSGEFTVHFKGYFSSSSRPHSGCFSLLLPSSYP